MAGTDSAMKTMSVGKHYVGTAHKPTMVTDSCVGNFTGLDQLNLITAKCTYLEINLITCQGLQHMLDVPIWGQIATVELFSPRDKKLDLLLLVTKEFNFFVLQWDIERSVIHCRTMGDVSQPGRKNPTNNKIGIVDPDGRAIGLHPYKGLFQAYPLDLNGIPKKRYDISLREVEVYDMKFLYDCATPTLAVLYDCDHRNFAVFRITFHADNPHGHWHEQSECYENPHRGSYLLIPVRHCAGGVIVIGLVNIVFLCENFRKEYPLQLPIIVAYVSIDEDGYEYLLAGADKTLHLLTLGPGPMFHIDIKPLEGVTSYASTISRLDDTVFFIGSELEDSKLIRLNKDQGVEVLKSYSNLGSLYDLCVANLRQGLSEIVTCSSGSLSVVRNKIKFTRKASLEVNGIRGLWSLRNGIDNLLVVTFHSNTCILKIRGNVLEETDAGGFSSQERTLFCNDALHDQFLQITRKSVRLISSQSGTLCHEWNPLVAGSIYIGTSNASQVLLSIERGKLVFLEIGNGELTERRRIELNNEISCLDISPIGEDPNRSELAAVGMWTEISVKVFSLPGLQLLATEHLGGEIIPRSVLLCSLDGISYLLCAIGDGNLVNFLLNFSNGELRLSDKKKSSLGTKPIALRTFSSRNVTYVFAASDRPMVLYSWNKRLFHVNVDLEGVNHMCPFNFASFPDSIVVANNGQLIIETVDDIQKLPIKNHLLPNGSPQCICHEDQYKTFAICSVMRNGTGYVSWLNDETFVEIGSLELDPFELGTSILSWSFPDDSNTYYCVGTEVVLPRIREPEPETLIKVVRVSRSGNGIAATVIDRVRTRKTVSFFTAVDGKVHATTADQKILVYNWVVVRNGSRTLQFECERVQDGAEMFGDLGAVEGKFIPYQDPATLIFCKGHGVIGLVASISLEDYDILMKLETLIMEQNGWGLLFPVQSSNFINGDVIESFLKLHRSQMEEIAHKLQLTRDEVCRRVECLKLFL